MKKPVKHKPKYNSNSDFSKYFLILKGWELNNTAKIETMNHGRRYDIPPKKFSSQKVSVFNKLYFDLKNTVYKM